MDEERVFLAALDRPDAAARAAYLDGACGADAEFRRQVEALLAAHFRSGEFLDVPAAEQIGAGPGRDDTLATPGAAAAGYEDAHGDSAELAFLAPPGRPGSLGRIGHYEVLEVLGRGGFGIVFRAFDEALRRVVAVKVLAPALAAASPARKRFLREARSSARVRHENVVQVYAVGERPLPHLVMEFVPGETLQQRIDRTGPLGAEEVVRIGRQVADGLAAAHATGLIHRDIKPANILLTGAGPDQHVRITDFGLARAADDASLTQSGVVAGTPLYMAPEQARCDALDHRADLFSLGSVMYTMCSGRPPFRASSTLAVLRRVAEDAPRPIPEVIPEAPRWLCDVIARLHAKRPDDRFQSAREVADLLGCGLAEMRRAGSLPLEAVARTPMGEAPRASPPSRPRLRPGRWVAAAALLLLLLGGLGLTEATGVTGVRGTVVRLFSPEGTLVVEVDDPDVSVTVDGSDVVITGAGPREIRLRPGRYTVEARKGGKVVSRELVSVTRNGRRVVRVTQEAAPKDSDRLAAEYVLSLGGSVRVDGEERDLKDASDLPRGPFRLTAVHLTGNTRVSDAGLARFKGCTNLTRLALNLTNVTDAGLAHFKGCTSLTSLDLGGTRVGDTGLASFAGCNDLTALALWGTQVGDDGLAHFKGCKNLTTIWLDQTRVSDAGLRNLAAMTRLEVLFMNLAMPNVTAAGIDELKKALPKCKIEWDVPDRRAIEYALSLGGAVRVNGEERDLKDASDLPPGPFRLTAVDLRENEEAGDAGLALFKDCQDVTHLWLQGTQVGDAGLAHLKGCKNLTDLDLKNTKVTAKGIDAVKKALPRCKILWDGGVVEPGAALPADE